MDTLKSIQITDATVLKGISAQLARMQSKNALPNKYRLRVLLRGTHRYDVRPEAEGEHALFLHVLNTTEGD